MAVEKMKKVSITAIRDQSDMLLKEIQKSGTIHFKELELQELPEDYVFLSKTAPVEDFELIEEKQVIDATLKALKPYVPKKSITAKRPRLTYEECCNYLCKPELKETHRKVKEILDKKDALAQEIKKAKSENVQLEQYAFIDFSTADLNDLKKVKAFLIAVKAAKEETFLAWKEAFPELYLEPLGKVKQDTVYLAVSERGKYQEVQDSLNQQSIPILDLSFEKPPRELIEYNVNRLKKAESELVRCNDALNTLGHRYDDILIELDAVNTVLSRNQVIENFLNSRHVIYMEGWVPEKDIPGLYNILDRMLPQSYYLEAEDVSPEDAETPVKLKNKGIFTYFESITEMFSLPAYQELDPTSILTIFYLIFFGMMVGDVGYGLILTLGCFFALRWIDFKEKTRRSVKMFFYLGISVILCGFLYGSMFGITIFAPVPVKGGGFKPILDTQTDIVFMLVLSLVIGVIHIFSGLVMKGLNSYIQKDYAGIFCDSVLWMLTLASGILLLLTGAGMLDLGSPKLFGIIFGICIAGLAATQGRSSKTLGGKIGGGLYGVYGLTSYIGDIVSYTRIVALGLSGAYIAFSFNLMSGLIPGVLGKLVFGTLIAVFGQALNLGLSLLGAYVHSCRLQYVEFFGKFYKGGGKAYRPFQVENDYISIKSTNQEDE
ncbi:V-type ATP synthase subunit I [Lacrimispora sp. JR3]|uniref:V-type ATP synthase subunit I n=1 Tax=Lacrimispora sinapis TaxID=3111456 RepID=UPI00374A1AA6